MVLERGTRERLYNAFPTVLSLSLFLLFCNRLDSLYDQGCLISMEQRPRRGLAKAIPAFFSRPFWGSDSA